MRPTRKPKRSWRDVTRDQWWSYLRVQKAVGARNMHDPRARRAAALSDEDFGLIQDNYAYLELKFAPRRPKCEVGTNLGCSGIAVRRVTGRKAGDPVFWCCLGCRVVLERQGVKLREVASGPAGE